MSAPRPRVVVHRGVVDAAAFAFDTNLLGEREARRRVLVAWSPGAEVFRADGLLILRLARAERVDARTAPGLALVERDGVLASAPLAERELERVAEGRDRALVVRGGVVVAVPLTRENRELPEHWLDLSGLELAEVSSLGAAPRAPRVVAAPEPFEPRERLGGVAPPPPELAQVVAALTGEAKAAPAEEPHRRLDPATRARLAGALQRVAALSKRFSAWFRRAVGRMASAPPARTVPRRPGLLDRLADRLDRLGAWLLRTTRLDALVGRRQAEYISQMMEMFESGDLANGLRHAIPLGAFEGLTRARPSLGVPKPRSDLRITPERHGAGSSIGMGQDLFAEIRKLYRAAFERLEAQERIEEAAFVLAELLRADEEAVAFLERHGKLRLAAEMAEARELPPGLVVRQWFVAGDRHRAVAIARRTGAFADAVLRLERTDKKQADVLRLLWAASLADAGDYAKAVEVAWPVADARRLALTWMDRAVELGGVEGARMLAKRLVVAPEAGARERALRLVEDDRPEGAAARASFATALSTGDRTPVTRALARASARSLLRDAPFSVAANRPSVYKALTEMADDGALRSDLPALPAGPSESLLHRDEAVVLRFDASDAGAFAPLDAVFLADGRTLVALGEAGAVLLARDGRTIARIDEPAHRLVVSDTGDRAIALAPRGDVWRLARIDLGARRAEAWCETRLDAWAESYDGSIWFVGAGDDFYAIDATARRLDALWRVPDVGGRTVAVARLGHVVTFLTAGEWNELVEWRYDLPLLRLRARNSVRLYDQGVIATESRLAISPEGVVADATALLAIVQSGDQAEIRPADVATLRLAWNGTVQKTVSLGESGTRCGTPAVLAGLAAVPVIREWGTSVLLVESSTARTLLGVQLSGAASASVRLRDEALTIADDRGRVIVLDLATGALVRNLRV